MSAEWVKESHRQLKSSPRDLLTVHELVQVK